MMKLEKTITSLEVAEVTGKLHKNVIKDIRTIIEHLGAVNDSHGSNLSRDISSYFIEDEYLNSRNQKQTMYRLTKKGAELFSTRMTGAKGTQFAAFYVERFNDMETHIKEERPLSELSYEELQLGKLRWTKKGIEFLAKRLPVLAYDNLHEAKQLTLL